MATFSHIASQTCANTRLAHNKLHVVHYLQSVKHLAILYLISYFIYSIILTAIQLLFKVIAFFDYFTHFVVRQFLAVYGQLGTLDVTRNKLNVATFTSSK